jgi:hypothetical protein
MMNGIARAVAGSWRIPLWAANFPTPNCATALGHQQWDQNSCKNNAAKTPAVPVQSGTVTVLGGRERTPPRPGFVGGCLSGLPKSLGDRVRGASEKPEVCSTTASRAQGAMARRFRQCFFARNSFGHARHPHPPGRMSSPGPPMQAAGRDAYFAQCRVARD